MAYNGTVKDSLYITAVPVPYGKELYMKHKLLALVLTFSLLLGSLSMVSCGGLGGLLGSQEKTYSEEELEKIVSGILAERDETNFDINQITIHNDSSANLLAASKGLLSTVSVYSTFEVRALSGFGAFQQLITTEKTGGGAGVIFRMTPEDKVKGDAYIVTNYHVVYHSASTSQNKIAKSIKLYLYGMEQERYAMDAEFVGGSMLYDIAVLKVSDSSVLRSATVLEADFADSDDVTVLETAIAIGNPELSGLSATVGHVNVDSEYVVMTLADDQSQAQMRLMRIDTAVNGGNSGGGLYNDRGQLIGIVNAKIVSNDIDNIGYAIPSNVARAVAESVLYYCDGKSTTNISRCKIGVTLVDEPESSTYFDAEAGKVHIVQKVTVESVNAGSLADGKLRAGDVLRRITIGGVSHDITRNYNIVETMLAARVGDTVVIDITRDGVDMQVEIIITEQALSAVV